MLGDRGDPALLVMLLGTMELSKRLRNSGTSWQKPTLSSSCWWHFPRFCGPGPSVSTSCLQPWLYGKMAQTDSQNCVPGGTQHGSVPCSEGAVLKLAGPAVGGAVGCGGGGLLYRWWHPRLGAALIRHTANKRSS